jgi:alpha-tubulin suppressor-like RCC1 family protein
MPTTNFKNSSGTDIGNTLVEKSYLIDRYPELADTFKQTGLYSTGYNNYGQLGDGTTTNRTSPVPTIAGGTTWKLVDGTHYNGSVAAIKTDGTLWTWGYNANGELGLGNTTNRSSPTQVGSSTTWKTVNTGNSRNVTMLAIKTDGTLWGWGYNSNWPINSTASPGYFSSPVQIGSETNWKEIGTGWANHIGAIKTNGTLWTWGYSNDRGSQGHGDDNINRSTPTQVGSDTNWKFLSVGNQHMSAIKTDGTLWGWGRNQEGQCGDGTLSNRSSPVQTISAGTNWKFVCAGGYTTGAIKTDGTLWLWGDGSWGNAGNGVSDMATGNPKISSPVQTITGGTNWKQVHLKQNTVSAIKTDGTLWRWGTIDGSTNASTPVQILPGTTNWKSTSSGMYTFWSIRDDSADIFGNSL